MSTQHQQLNKEQVIESLAEKRKPTVWQNFHLSEVKEVDPERLVLGEHEAALTHVSYRQLLRELKIPKSFYDNLDPKVRTRVVAHQRGLIGETRLKSRFSEDLTECQAIVNPDFNEIIAEEIIQSFPEWPCVEISGDYNTPIIHFRGVYPDVEIDEKTYAAFSLTMSEVGACDLTINAMIYVVICTNGIIRRRATNPYFLLPMHLLDKAELNAVLTLLPERITADNERLAARIQSMKSEKVNLAEIIDFWLQSKDIPKVVPKKTAARAEVDQLPPDIAVFDLMQLVSNIGRQLESYPTRIHFENVAGNLLNMPIVDAAALAA